MLKLTKIKDEDLKSEKKRGRGQIMSEYHKTKLNLRKNQEVKKEEEGSNYARIY